MENQQGGGLTKSNPLKHRQGANSSLFLCSHSVNSCQRTNKDGEAYQVFVYPKEIKDTDNFLFSEFTFISRTAIAIQLGNHSASASEYLKTLTFSKAKGRIIFGNFEADKIYRQEISSTTLKTPIEEIPDKTVQRHILSALKRIRRRNPLKYKMDAFDIDAFSQILLVDKKQIFYNLSLLLEDDSIEMTEDKEENLETGKFYITSYGLEFLEELEQKNVPNILTKAKGSQVEIYDVALSFTGEDRKYAEDIAKKLVAKGIKVFYDEFEQGDLWGKNLYDHLNYIYGYQARFCVIFVSEHYAKKNWTNLERQAAQAKAFRERSEYILPLKIDDTQIPGINETVGYISLDKTPIDKVVDLIFHKVVSSK